VFHAQIGIIFKCSLFFDCLRGNGELESLSVNIGDDDLTLQVDKSHLVGKPDVEIDELFAGVFGIVFYVKACPNCGRHREDFDFREVYGIDAEQIDVLKEFFLVSASGEQNFVWRCGEAARNGS